MIVDLDATLITAHSEKEQAAPTFKRGFGFHPLGAFADHGPDGTGEPLTCLLRRGNAGSNTAADHLTVVKAALVQLPGHKPGTQPGRKVLIRADAAGGTHDLLNWLVSQRLSYSVGFTLPDTFAATPDKMPKKGWTPAYDGDGPVRDGAWVADVTGLLELTSGPNPWPAGMRVIVRKERPHPGAQARLRAESDLVRHRRACRRAHRLDADAHPARSRREALGAQTPTATPVQHRRPTRRTRSRTTPAPVDTRTLGPGCSLR